MRAIARNFYACAAIIQISKGDNYAQQSNKRARAMRRNNINTCAHPKNTVFSKNLTFLNIKSYTCDMNVVHASKDPNPEGTRPSFFTLISRLLYAYTTRTRVKIRYYDDKPFFRRVFS